MRTIRVVVRRDGTQEVEVLGASGPECIELTRRLERRLGRLEGVRVLKPEHDDVPREHAEGEREGAS